MEEPLTAQIELVNASGESVTAHLSGTCDRATRLPTFRLSLNAGDVTASGEGTDYFNAFCRIREALAAYGLVPHCYGAARNVYPSGMGRDMGRGLEAYRMTHGQHVSGADLVYIFDSGPDLDPASVAEQHKFAERWRQSLLLIPQPPAGG